MADFETLAAALRELRTGAGLTTYQLAEMLGRSQAHVSRTERAATPTPPDPELVAAWALATSAPPRRAAELVDMAASLVSQTRSWQQVHGGGVAGRQVQMHDVHLAMTQLCEFANGCVPGLLQTPAYATRILELADVAGKGGIPEAVARRMNNQSILYDPSRTFRYVLTEGALRFRAGPAEVMLAQAEKLVNALTLPNLTLTVIPWTTAPAALYQNSFVIYEIPDGPWVLTEALSQEQQLRGAWDLTLHREVFGRLEGSGATGQAAADLIREAMTG